MKCKTFLEFDEISQPQNHSHAKILFVQAFVIASLNVILPEENSDINSAIKILFIDILKVKNQLKLFRTMEQAFSKPILSLRVLRGTKTMEYEPISIEFIELKNYITTPPCK